MKDMLAGNKLIAAVLIAVAVAWIANFVAGQAVSSDPTTRATGFVEGAPPMASGGADASVSAAPAAAPAVAGPAEIEPLLAAANPEAGAKFAKVCSACHSFNKGEPARVGPNLYNVVGAPHGHMQGYGYSDAMKAGSGKTWSFASLNRFLFNPRGEVPGTKMTFAGIKNDADRANVIAWLRTLSDHPEPLPGK